MMIGEKEKMKRKKLTAGLALILSLSSSSALAWNDPGSDVSFSSNSSSYSRSSESAGNLFVSKSWIARPEKFRPRSKDQCSPAKVSLQGLSKDPRDQGSRGYCFAYAAADLISQKLRTEVSAIDVAFAYFKKNSQDAGTDHVEDLAGGYPDEAALAAAGRGFCKESALPSNSYADLFLKDPKFRAYLAHQYPDIEVYIRTGYGWQFAPRQFRDFSGIVRWLGEVHSSYKNGRAKNGQPLSVQSAYSDLHFIFPGISEQEFQSALDKNRKSSSIDFVDDVLGGVCEGERVSFNQKIEAESVLAASEGKVNGAPLFSKLDSGLDRGSMVAIDYYVDEMIEEKNLEQLGFSSGKKGSPHASSIIERRFNDQTLECEYLIRNSWGKSCEIYSHAFKDRCNNGYIWVGESFLDRNLFGVFYLK